MYIASAENNNNKPVPIEAITKTQTILTTFEALYIF